MADVYDIRVERAARLEAAGADPRAMLIVEWHGEGYVLSYRDGAEEPDGRILAAELAHILSRTAVNEEDVTEDEIAWLERLRDKLYRQGEFKP